MITWILIFKPDEISNPELKRGCVGVYHHLPTADDVIQSIKICNHPSIRREISVEYANKIINSDPEVSNTWEIMLGKSALVSFQ